MDRSPFALCTCTYRALQMHMSYICSPLPTAADHYHPGTSVHTISSLLTLTPSCWAPRRDVTQLTTHRGLQALVQTPTHTCPNSCPDMCVTPNSQLTRTPSSGDPHTHLTCPRASSRARPRRCDDSGGTAARRPTSRRVLTIHGNDGGRKGSGILPYPWLNSVREGE
jgi:hypothetical protein